MHVSCTHVLKIYLVPWFIISLAILWAYLPALDAPMVLDDIRTIVDNPFIQDLDNFADPVFLLSPRPIADLSFALNFALHGQDPYGYRLVNIIFHVFNSCLVYILAYWLLGRVQGARRLCAPAKEVSGRKSSELWVWTGALSTALVFAIHPLQTMAVTYIAQRYTSLAALFCLLAVGFYIAARVRIENGYQKSGPEDKAGPGQGSGQGISGRSVVTGLLLACSLLAAVVAFLSKQNAIMLPGFILLIEFLVFDRSRSKRLWVLAGTGLFIFFFGAAVLYFQGIFDQGMNLGHILSDISHKSVESRDVSRWIYLCTQFGVIVRYMALTVVPVGQNIDHMYPFVSGFWDGWTPAFFLVLLACVALALVLIRRRPLISLGIGWMFIALSVESGIIPIRDAMFEHRMYMPLFGPSVIFGYFVYWAGNKVLRPWLVLPAAVCILLLLGGLTHARNQLWDNPVALWTDSVQKNPENDRAWNNLGKAELEQENLEQAEEHFHQALDINPKHPRAKGNLGYIFYLRGEYEKALPYVREAAQALPRSADYQYNLGVLYSELGKPEQAVTYYRKALRLRPEYHQARRNLGVELAKQGKLQQASKILHRVLEHEPENFNLLKNLSLIKLKTRKFSQAEDLMRRALEIRPQSPAVLTYLGIALYEQGEFGESREYLLQAISQNPNNPLAKKYIYKAQQGE